MNLFYASALLCIRCIQRFILFSFTSFSTTLLSLLHVFCCVSGSQLIKTSDTRNTKKKSLITWLYNWKLAHHNGSQPIWVAIFACKNKNFLWITKRNANKIENQFNYYRQHSSCINSRERKIERKKKQQHVSGKTIYKYYLSFFTSSP